MLHARSVMQPQNTGSSSSLTVPGYQEDKNA